MRTSGILWTLALVLIPISARAQEPAAPPSSPARFVVTLVGND
jgi:hypothetical protein